MALIRGERSVVVWVAAAALLISCVTRPVLEPGPCRRVEEVPGLDAELTALREADLSRVELGLPAISWETRVYVVGADAHCAGDRALLGEPLLREPITSEPLSLRARLTRWLARLFAF